MRIAFVNSTHKWGGVKTWTLEAAAALNGLGHETVVYGRPGPFPERARSMGVEAHEVAFGPDGNPLAIARFVRGFSKRNIQAVVVNVGKDVRSAGIAGRLLGIPVIQRLGLPGDVKNTAKVRLVQRLVGQRYLTTCEYIKAGFLDRFPDIPGDRVAVIHTGKTPAPTAPDSVHAPRRLVTTSQLTRDKGHADLLKALAILRDEGLDFTWDVAGTGPLTGELHTLASELGLADRVTFHGFTQNVTALLDGCDIFVLPSMDEGLPNTALEAMARGLAPVARNVGGTGELWPQSCADFLVDPSPGPDHLAAALRTALQADDATLLQWKHDAWTTCTTRFDQHAQARKLERYFERCIAP